MTLFGIDVSNYQSTAAVKTYMAQGVANFVICNIGDKGYADKVDAIRSAGKLWGAYIWVHPGENMYVSAMNAVSKMRSVSGNTPLGLWFDFEENGVANQQLVDGFAGADSVGMKAGYYANSWRVDHNFVKSRSGWRPYWYCAYPGSDNGDFPGFNQMHAARDVQMWQYSSTKNHLDRDVIVDEPWLAGFLGLKIPQVAPINSNKGDIDMLPTDVTGHLVTPHGEWFQTANGGIQTVSGPFYGSYGSLPTHYQDNPNRRFYCDPSPRADGLPGYVLHSNDGGHYSFPFVGQ